MDESLRDKLIVEITKECIREKGVPTESVYSKLFAATIVEFTNEIMKGIKKTDWGKR